MNESTPQAPIVSWVPDPVLAGFEAVSLPLPPADDGSLAATLVRRRAPRPTGRAVLYVHGFVDYFFHAHVAKSLNASGWDVYALDLRRSGRSLRSGNRPYFVRDLDEYHEELSLAISVIVAERGHRLLCLTGHSAGGLVAALYMHSGALRDRVQALALNSPFFAFNIGALERLVFPLVTAFGGVVRHLPIPGVLAPAYVQSLHRDFKGEWTFDLRWKPERGFPAYTGWLHAIRAGQRTLQRGLSLTVPVLLLRSAHSLRVRGWDDRAYAHDIVLNVSHMVRAIPQLGAPVTDVPIAGAVHDVFLSAPGARGQALSAYVSWLESLPVPLVLSSR